MDKVRLAAGEMAGVTYLKDVWYCAALSSEIADKPFGRIICDKPMVLFRTGSGKVAALGTAAPIGRRRCRSVR